MPDGSARVPASAESALHLVADAGGQVSDGVGGELHQSPVCRGSRRTGQRRSPWRGQQADPHLLVRGEWAVVCDQYAPVRSLPATGVESSADLTPGPAGQRLREGQDPALGIGYRHADNDPSTRPAAWRGLRNLWITRPLWTTPS